MLTLYEASVAKVSCADAEPFKKPARGRDGALATPVEVKLSRQINDLNRQTLLCGDIDAKGDISPMANPGRGLGVGQQLCGKAVRAKRGVQALEKAWAAAKPAARVQWLIQLLDPLEGAKAARVAGGNFSSRAGAAVNSFLIACTTRNRRSRTKARVLHQTYSNWAERTGEVEITACHFGRLLRAQGLIHLKSSVNWWLGVETLPPPAAIPSRAPDLRRRCGAQKRE